MIFPVQRFNIEHVKRSTTELTILQQQKQDGFIDQGAPGRVDQNSCLLHGRDFADANQFLVMVIKHCMEEDEITLSKH